jgi:hypothetical protein
MSFEYSQASGKMTGSDGLSAQGYSGNGAGLNNPAAQCEHAVGPLPQGTYTIGAPHADAVVGPIAMRLTPAPANEMFARGDFLIHGDNSAMNHTASEGCIIMPKIARLAIGAAVLAGDTQLTVTA